MANKSPISLVIADDHAMILLGFEQAISYENDLSLLATASTGEEAIAAYKKLKPDVLLVDYRMPQGEGTTVTEEVLKFDPDATVLIHSAFDEEELAWNAVQVGVSGYLIKESDVTATLDAIRKVAAGETYFPPSIEKKIKAREKRQPLTERELEVLQLLSIGLGNQQIRDHLVISEATVRYHVSNILRKLDAYDRTHAVVKAARRGLINF